VSDTPLPDGLITMIKTATRALVTACAAPGSTGPERVEQLTGFARGTITRWQGDQYPDVIPLHVVFLLSITVQTPVFARTLAALTGHRVEPLEGGSTPAGDLLGDVLRVTGSHARFINEAATALDDLKVTPGEAKNLLKSGLKHQDEMMVALQRLARIAEGSP
jgi:hypothetical protein